MMKVLRFNFVLVVCILLYSKAFAQAPEVSAFLPQDNALAVSPQVDLVIIFDQSIQKGQGEVYIRRQSDDVVVETIDIANTRVTISQDSIITIDPVNNLASGVRHYIQVGSGAITNLAGVAFPGIANTSTWNFTTACSPPPTELAVNNISPTSAVLSWNAVAGVDAYDVFVGGLGIVASGISANSLEISNLVPGTRYYFHIRARCTDISGNFSTALYFTTTVEGCTAVPPATLSITDLTQTTVTLNWTPVSGAISYDVYVGERGMVASNITATSLALEGLTPGNREYFLVRSRCSADLISPFSRALYFVTQVEGCSATPPTTLNVGSITATSASLSWSTVPGATSYDVFVGGRGLVATNITTTNYNLTGLTRGTTNYFLVRAKCSTDLISEFSKALYFNTDICEAVPPSTLVATDISATSATLNWTAVTGASGYDVFVGGIGLVATNIAGTSFEMQGLTPGTTYYYLVRSRCSYGSISSFSRSYYFNTEVDGCEAIPPSGLSVTNVGSTSATLNWNAVPGVIGYDVFVGGLGLVATNINETSYQLNGLNPGTTYYFLVRSRCSENLVSSFSTAFYFNTLSGATSFTSNQISGEWASHEEVSETPLLEVNIFPNPSADEVSISVDNSEKITSIQVLDQRGKYVMIVEGLSSNMETIGLAKYGSGLYLVKIIINDSHHVVKKVIIQ